MVSQGYLHGASPARVLARIFSCQAKGQSPEGCPGRLSPEACFLLTNTILHDSRLAVKHFLRFFSGYNRRVSGIAQIITSLATLLAAVATMFGVLRNTKSIKQVHSEVKTANGITLAALADRTEGRRIKETIPHDDRTPSETGYVDMLREGGRNVGHGDELE